MEDPIYSRQTPYSQMKVQVLTPAENIFVEARRLPLPNFLDSGRPVVNGLAWAKLIFVRKERDRMLPLKGVLRSSWTDGRAAIYRESVPAASALQILQSSSRIAANKQLKEGE